MNENSIAKLIVDAAYQIHVKVGPGLLESAYHSMLFYESKQRNLSVESEVPIPMFYGDISIPVAFRAFAPLAPLRDLNSYPPVTQSSRNPCRRTGSNST